MYKYLIFFLPIFLLAGEQNLTANKDKNGTKVIKRDTNTTKNKLLQKHLEEEMRREAKYAKEKAFYMGKDYNLTEHKVDPKSLKKIKTIEPDYDFNMDEGVYSD